MATSGRPSVKAVSGGSLWWLAAEPSPKQGKTEEGRGGRTGHGGGRWTPASVTSAVAASGVRMGGGRMAGRRRPMMAERGRGSRA